MNKQELKQENEDLLLYINSLNLENEKLKQKINNFQLKKCALLHSTGNLETAKHVYNWLTEKGDPDIDTNSNIIDETQQYYLWDEFLGMISWKFTPRVDGEMILDLDSVYENDLKGKYKLVKL